MKASIHINADNASTLIEALERITSDIKAGFRQGSQRDEDPSFTFTVSDDPAPPPKPRKDYRPETKSLVEDFIAAGFTIVKANDGGDVAKFESVDQIVEHLTAVDEAWLYVARPEGTAKLFLVFGNEPGAIVNDYGNSRSISGLVDEVTTKHNEKWCDREQPMRSDR